MDEILIDLHGKSSVAELTDEELVFGLCESIEGRLLMTEYLKGTM